MLLAEDFRAMARDALRGRWPGAAGVALLAAFLGATMVDGASFNFNVGQKDVELFRRIYEGGAWHAYVGFIIGATIILIVYWLRRRHPGLRPVQPEPHRPQRGAGDRPVLPL